MADFELPGYELYERLGRGGMATVYRALHLNLDREVAIKVMDPAMNADSTFSERFIREARISARLTHPHILQIYDVNTYNGLNYIAMELLGGGELADFIHGEMPQRQIYTILRQMTEALDYAASRGYVHRDIKPSNIMLRAPGDFVLADFGIARAANSGTQMTQTGLMVGTPSYMSPEQAKGEEVDGRSDLYALGVLTFEMLTKQLPYESDSAVTTAVKHLTEAIPTLPENLAAYQDFINKALAKLPEDRFQTGAEMYRAFMEASAGFDDEQVLTAAAPPRPSRASMAQADESERTSLAGVDATRFSHSSSPAVSGSSRPYRLEGSQQRERLVSGTFDSGRRRQKKSGTPVALWLVVVLVLAGAGYGGYYWWQGQQGGASGNQREITGELARAYNAMNRDDLSGAAASFYKVLSMDSKNAAAQQGMDEVGRLYGAAIQEAIDAGDVGAARALLVDFGGYYANASNLASLQEKVDMLEENRKLAAAQDERVRKLVKEAQQSIAAEDFERADELLRQATAINPGHEEIAAQRATLEAAQAKSAAYEERWSAYTPEQRTAFAGAIAAADAALDAGELQVADGALKEAAAIAPEAPELSRRSERLDAARAQEAEALAEERAQMEARLDEADTAVANIAADPENAGKAVAIYNEVGAQYPDEPRVAAGLAAVTSHYVSIARQAAGKGDFDGARAALASAEQLVPGAKDVASFEAKLPALETKWAERESALAQEREELQAALKKAEDTVAAGQRAARSGDLDRAQEAYDQVMNSNPGLPSLPELGSALRDAYARAARDQVALNDLDAARGFVSRGSEHFPDDPRWQQLQTEIDEAKSSSRRRLGAY